MFGYISTKELYLLKLDTKNSENFVTCYSEGKARYTLGKKKYGFYIDIFTGTKHYIFYNASCGGEYVVEARSIIIDRRYVKKEHAELMLQELNPTCLNVKRLVKRK